MALTATEADSAASLLRTGSADGEGVEAGEGDGVGDGDEAGEGDGVADAASDMGTDMAGPRVVVQARRLDRHASRRPHGGWRRPVTGYAALVKPTADQARGRTA
ncbi:hypothetical protein SLNHY_2938 [Streptomyces albus]|nr:hypothetical protein SLNHY_2938 [Streptomyces albus]